MKKITLLFCTIFIAAALSAQKVKIVTSSINIKPVIDSLHKPNAQLLNITLRLSGAAPIRDTTINFELQPFKLPNNPTLITPAVVIPRSKWLMIPAIGGNFETELTLRTISIDTFVQVEIGHIVIDNQPEFIELRLTNPVASQPPAPKTPHVAAAKPPVKYLRLDKAETSLNPIYTKDSAEAKIITIRIYSQADSATNDTITLVSDKLQFPFSPDIKSENPIIINKANWVKIDTSKTKDKKTLFYYDAEVYIKNPYTDTINNDLISTIKMKGDDETFHALRLTENGTHDYKSFWVDLGANFDLFENLKANNFYTGVFMFVKDIAGNFFKKGGRRISFTGGVYETKSLEVNIPNDTTLIYRDGRSFRTMAAGYPYFRDTGKITTSSTIANLGIFYSPHIRLNKKPTYEYGFHWYLSFYAEMLWQRINTTYNYDQSKINDTLYATDLNTLYSKASFKQLSEKQDYRTQYVGLGLPVYITQKNFSLYVNLVFGWCNQKYQILQNPLETDPTITNQYNKTRSTAFTGLAQPKHLWTPFGLAQFRLNDERVGISFTGEVRSLLRKNVKPNITLTLSKKFDLAGLYKALVKPFTGND